MAQRVSARLTARDGRRFGLTVGAAFLVLAFLLWWRAQGSLSGLLVAPVVLHKRHVLAALFALGGASLMLAGLTLPTHLGGIQRAWMALAQGLSKVTTPMFMAAVYFLVLTPTAIVMRLLGRNPLVSARPGASAWIPRAQQTSDLERQF